MSSDGIIDQLTRYGEFGEEELWTIFSKNYLMKTPEQRIVDLKAVDSFIESHTEGHTGVTKELASLVSRRRDLLELHTRLRNAGR